MSLLTPFAKTTPATRRLVTVGTWVFLGAVLMIGHRVNGIIPSPLGIMRAWITLSQDGLIQALGQSFVLNIAALGIAMVLGCGLAYLSVIPLFRPLIRTFSKFRFLGLSGVSFVLGIFVFGRWLQIWMLVLGTVTFFVTAMLSVVGSVPDSDLDYARTLRMTPWQMTYEMVIRGTLERTLDVIRENAAMSWVMLTFVEGAVRSEGGLGVLMIDLSRRIKLEEIFAVQATIVIVAIAQDEFLGALRAWLCPYAQAEKE